MDHRLLINGDSVHTDSHCSNSEPLVYEYMSQTSCHENTEHTNHVNGSAHTNYCGNDIKHADYYAYFDSTTLN